MGTIATHVVNAGTLAEYVPNPSARYLVAHCTGGTVTISDGPGATARMWVLISDQEIAIKLLGRIWISGPGSVQIDEWDEAPAIAMMVKTPARAEAEYLSTFIHDHAEPSIAGPVITNQMIYTSRIGGTKGFQIESLSVFSFPPTVSGGLYLELVHFLTTPPTTQTTATVLNVALILPGTVPPLLVYPDGITFDLAKVCRGLRLGPGYFGLYLNADLAGANPDFWAVIDCHYWIVEG